MMLQDWLGATAVATSSMVMEEVAPPTALMPSASQREDVRSFFSGCITKALMKCSSRTSGFLAAKLFQHKRITLH